MIRFSHVLNSRAALWYAALTLALLATTSSPQRATAEAPAPASAAAAVVTSTADHNVEGDVRLLLEGYDPVSYFKSGKPVEGKANIAARYRDLRIQFASAANRKQFLANPEAYLPAYGGWCAYAMGAKGEKVEVDPKAFELRDGRLFVFYRTLFTDTRKPWAKDREALRDKADAQWTRLSKEPAPIDGFKLERVGGGKPFVLTEILNGAPLGDKTANDDRPAPYVALHFLLKTECPVCVRHTHDYYNRQAEVPGVTHVFIKPDTDAEIQQWAKRLSDVDDDFAIYRDPNATLAESLHIPSGYKFHGQVVHYPAFVLIDPARREAFRYVGKNNSDRFGFDQFKTMMTEIRKQAPAAEVVKK